MKLYDGLRSLISNLGNPLKDKAAATVYDRQVIKIKDDG